MLESNRKYKLNHDGLICQFCGKECKNRNSLCNHERLCKENPDRQESAFVKYNKEHEHSWNYGLTKETNDTLKQMGINYSENYANGLYKSNSHPHTKETKSHLSRSRIKQISEGKSNARGITGRYKNIWCDSSYELIYLVYCLDHNINIIRNKDYFKYIYNNEEHNYLPDFYLCDNDMYVELKGRNIYYNEDIVNIKQEAVLKSGHNYNLLFYEDILKYQKWIEKKYNLKGYKEICNFFYDDK